MSRWWLITVAVLIVGGLLETMILTDPGYVVISWGDFAFETSLWFGLLVAAGIWLFVRLIVASVRLIRRSVSKVSGFGEARRANKSREATGKGLLLWAEGDWQQSLRLLRDSADTSALPLVNHLFAAASAQKLGEATARDHHLQAAVALEPAGEFAISLTRADYLLESGKADEALSLLKLLYTRAPKHPMVAKHLLEAAERAGDFVLALDVLASPALRGVVDEATAKKTQVRLWQGRLSHEGADTTWSEVPAELKHDVRIVGAHVDRLVADGGADRAAAVIESALKHSWSSELVRRFGSLHFTDTRRGLQKAEQWLSKQEQDPILLLVLGQLALRAGDLDKAESLLKTLLRLHPGPEVALEMARLFMRRGDSARAAEFFQQAFPS